MDNILLNIGSNEYSVNYDKDNHSIIYIDDKPYEVELLKTFGSDVFSFLVNQRIFQVGLDFGDDSNLEISLDGLTYSIASTDEMKKVLGRYIANNGGAGKAGAGTVKAPMPGLVVKILVKEGMQVVEDEKLIVIEAMKMENTLKSPVTGVVKSVKVIEGQAVEKGAVLIEIEV
ncbi:MAG: acetyl-CoA carboxylase biotin carboxyl carrier protein subunit [Candidatus Kapabacteria bacterium]|nr:acetyl-CoA carboxylase biotin carboxyl carrier protein subunit [Ignavibacteriota bacterium]MCW5883803.1 acetyl-CoA carboxylase biotin carboxyl carrier protein subunit [Candidatus Kapabacteria bacterium]